MKLTKRKRLLRRICWTKTVWYRWTNLNRGQFIPGGAFYDSKYGQWKQETEEGRHHLTGAHATKDRIVAVPVLKPAA